MKYTNVCKCSTEQLFQKYQKISTDSVLVRFAQSAFQNHFERFMQPYDMKNFQVRYGQCDIISPTDTFAPRNYYQII